MLLDVSIRKAGVEDWLLNVGVHRS